MAKKNLVTEKNVKDAWQKKTALVVSKNSIFTPLAKDSLKELKVQVIFEEDQKTKTQETKAQTPILIKPQQSSAQTDGFTKVTTYPSLNEVSINRGKIAIGSDHGGFKLKEFLKEILAKSGYETIDFGTNSTEAVDYPDFAQAVALSVSRKETSAGIMIDSVGVASAMVCNKIKNIRAASCNDLLTAKSSREHNNANVLTLGGKMIGEMLASEIVKTWLTTNFAAGRHQKRVEKIAELEK